MATWEDEQQTHRRFQHQSKTGRKKGAGRAAGGDAFQPRNMLGRYSVRCPAIAKLTAVGGDGEATPDMWLEIHDLVESQTGYLATFDFGLVSGVMLIAGSRRGLQTIVDEAEEEDAEESNDENDEDGDDDEEEDASGSELDNNDSSFVKPPELERPSHAFEKNTFRTPKWFARFRGHVARSEESTSSAIDDPQPEEQDDQSKHGDELPQHETNGVDNKVHFEFSSSACRDFQATFSCPDLDLREASLQGWKVTSKPSTTSIRWNGFQ